MDKGLPSPGRLAELFRYDPETGKIYNRVKRGTGPSARPAGAEVGTKHKQGYLVIGLAGRSVMAHRIAFCLHHGKWPALYIDHKNCNRSDNRACNLREASWKENRRNQPNIRKLSTLPKGVDRSAINGKFRARIIVDGKRYDIGGFDTPEAAHAAYVAAAQHHFGEFANPG